MSRQRGVHRELRRFLVANLAHHDDIGILAKDVTQPRNKIIADFRTDLRLVKPLDEVLDRILETDYVNPLLVQDLQEGVKRRGLAGARRPGDKYHAVRPLDRLLKHGEVTADRKSTR